MIICGQSAIPIIPRPVAMQVKEGDFVIDNHTALRYNPADQQLRKQADFFSSYVSGVSGYLLPKNAKLAKYIAFRLVNSPDLGQEGYRLDVTHTAIIITANSGAGIFYGIQSLFQLLPPVRTNAALKVPCMAVTDFPRFKWRGMMLDVSRHFFSPNIVKEFIDLMAQYKMNVFHWHLCDDQGWRLEIKKYPELTKVGAWRAERPGKIWGDCEPARAGEPAEYGGFYTQDQVREIVAYAKARNITIVPEIEMPGHSAAAMSAYPWLSCSQQPQLPVTGGQYPRGLQTNYCPGSDSAFMFLQHVLSEVIRLFPSTYIHVGGDEVDKTPWKNCSRCQARIRAEHLKDENELQSYVIRRIEKFLIAKKRKLIGWDEILEGGLAPEATVMSWRGEGGGIQAAKMKHDVIMTPGSPCYFDHYQAGPEGEPIAIGGFNSLRKVYGYEPVPRELGEEEEKYVLGAQGNVWTEYIATPEHLEYMVLPRMAALAEVLWSPKESRDWAGFNQRIVAHFKAYDQKGLHYCPGNFTVDIKPVAQNGRLFVTLSTEAYQGTVYYTLDGSAPTAQSIRYDSPVELHASATLKAATVVNGNVMGLRPAEQSFVMHQAVGRDVTYTNPISRYYQADGPNTLTDGIKGTASHGKYWHGINGKDLIATIDLGAPKPIHSLTLGCLQKYGDWIFLPQWVKFEVSTDGKIFTEAGTVINTISPDARGAILKDFTVSASGGTAQFIRMTAKILDGCPKGHNGEGQPAWLFADEIVVQ